jgi:hypothetical protein
MNLNLKLNDDFKCLPLFNDHNLKQFARHLHPLRGGGKPSSEQFMSIFPALPSLNYTHKLHPTHSSAFNIISIFSVMNVAERKPAGREREKGE